MLTFKKRGWLTEEQDRLMQDNERTNVLTALQQAETKSPPLLETMFEDVYDVKTPHLLVRLSSFFVHCYVICHENLIFWLDMQEQEREMLEHVAKYPDYYP